MINIPYLFSVYLLLLLIFVCCVWCKDDPRGLSHVSSWGAGGVWGSEWGATEAGGGRGQRWQSWTGTYINDCKVRNP